MTDDATAVLASLREEMTESANALLPGLDPGRAYAAGGLHACALKALAALDVVLERHRPVQLYGRVEDYRGNIVWGTGPDHDSRPRPL